MKKGKNKAAAAAAGSGSTSNLSGGGTSGPRPGIDAPALFIGLDGPISDSKSKCVACSPPAPVRRLWSHLAGGRSVRRTPCRLRVNDAVCAELAKIAGPIVVVTVAGLYRTGKSFILNQLAGSQGGFDIGASVGTRRLPAASLPSVDF